MPHPTIDLSWLAQLLTKTPTADTQANTPDLDPGSVGKFLNPNPTSQADIDTSQPYQPPSNIQRLVWGPQSAAIDTLNNQFSAYPRQQNLQNLTDLAIRAANVSRRPSYLQTPGMTPEQAAASGQGDINQPMPSITGANANAIYAAGGGAPLDAAAMHNLATQQIEEARARTQTAATGNALGTPITRATAENAGENLGLQYNLGRQGVLPSEFNRAIAENRFGSAQATGQLGLLPSRLSLEGTQLGNEQAIASQAAADRPFITGAQRGQDIQRYLESERMPVQSPFSNRINLSDASVSPIRSDELGANPFALQFLGLKDIGAVTGKGTADESFTDASGKVWHMKTNPLTSRPTESVLQGGMNPPIGGGSNNVTNGVETNRTGSMTPPVPTASSATTLPMNSPITPSQTSSEEGSYEIPPSYESTNTKRPQMGEGQYQNVVENSLSKIMSKYGANINNAANQVSPYQKGGILGLGVDKNMVTDFLQQNAKNMSKDDLKLAVSLMHKLPD